VRYLDDCPDGFEPALARSLELIKGVAQRERAKCAEEIREMADEFPHAVRIVLRLAAERLVGG
jgi:hypothetical protein